MFRGFCPRTTFLSKKFYTFQNLFFHFLQDYILLRLKNFCDHSKINSNRHRTFIDPDRSKNSREWSRTVENSRINVCEFSQNDFIKNCHFCSQKNQKNQKSSETAFFDVLSQLFSTDFDSSRPFSTFFDRFRLFSNILKRIDHNGRIGRWPSSNDHKRKVCLSKVVYNQNEKESNILNT